MTEIRNGKELRTAYEWIYLIDQTSKAGWRNLALEELLREMKVMVRAYNKRVSDRHTVGGNDLDRVIFLIDCPNDVTTREEAEEWFCATEKVDIQPSPYDCTGRWFTSWHKVFERHGKWMCYHCMCADV